MGDFVVRPAVEGEQRGLLDVLRVSLHVPPLDDEQWARYREGFPADRKIGAFVGGRPIGVASALGTAIAVPGGKVAPAAAVNGVGVRADHTRRGVLTAMMREQLRDLHDRGEIIAVLHASETAIYGRFGYGIGSRCQDLRIDSRKANLIDQAPGGGRVRLLDSAEAAELVPELYRRIGLGRPGMVERTPQWWSFDNRLFDEYLVAVHTGPSGDDGFAMYQPEDRVGRQSEVVAALAVRDLHAGNTAALAGLWRFFLNIDLVTEVRAPGRPLDEPLPLMLTDPRACRVTKVVDELWVRLVDVPAALAARQYGDGEAVVLDVRDSFLPQNSGRYRVGGDGVFRTDQPADLQLDVDTLAMIYLGEWPATALAAAGRIEAVDADGPARADELFRTSPRPWCGTRF